MGVRRASLTMVVLVALSAATSHAASIAVVAEGGSVYRYELVLGPGEGVAGIQLDLLTESSSVVFENPGFPVPLTIAEIWLADPWHLLNHRQISSGILRMFRTFDQLGGLPVANPAAGLTHSHIIQPDGNRQTYLDFIDADLGVFASFRDPSYVPTGGIPFMRLTVLDGPVPTLWTSGICAPVEEAFCDLPMSGVISDAPEPPLAGLLALVLVGVATIRSSMSGARTSATRSAGGRHDLPPVRPRRKSTEAHLSFQ